MAEAYSRYCATCHTMFWHPQVCAACGGGRKAYGRYMLKHQPARDGSARAADNWKRGIDRAAYMDSLLRHVIDLWDAFEHEELELAQTEELCSAILFNAQGFLYETIRN